MFNWTIGNKALEFVSLLWILATFINTNSKYGGPPLERNWTPAQPSAEKSRVAFVCLNTWESLMKSSLSKGTLETRLNSSKPQRHIYNIYNDTVYPGEAGVWDPKEKPDYSFLHSHGAWPLDDKHILHHGCTCFGESLVMLDWIFIMTFVKD